MDTRDPVALAEAAAGIPGQHGRLAGMLSYDEWSVEATAQAAERLNLVTSAPSAITACRDKATTRAVLRAAGVPQPESVPVNTVDDAQAAAERLGYPVVVKARRLAGSIGVVRVDDSEALRQAYHNADAVRFPGVVRDGSDVLVEQYLDGPEVSVDSVVVDGVVSPLVLARKEIGMDPYFEETGHVVDAADPLLNDETLRDHLDRVHAGLGITHGMTHTEFRLTPQGPRLVEVNARLGGDFIPYLGQLATGIDLTAVAGAVATGAAPDLTPTTRRVAAIRFLYPPHDCQVLDVTVHTARMTPSMHAAVATATPGQEMALPPRGYLSRYGHLIAVADTVEQARAVLDLAPHVIELHHKRLGA
ncbi:ATP-grasp domain-containing protein [Micromonospora sp. NPDC047620]|uniref:ATP-grasp domain-containing protein n=1 Tax=Micromonospora sp. NPDC047620 TaxID=3364251 RepID=UPI0037201A5E